MIVDLLPTLARLYFSQRLPGVTLSFVQSALLLGLGLQYQTIDDLQKQLKAPASQVDPWARETGGE